jgi:hypothetical protein
MSEIKHKYFASIATKYSLAYLVAIEAKYLCFIGIVFWCPGHYLPACDAGANPRVLCEYPINESQVLSPEVAESIRSKLHIFFFFTPWSESASELFRPSDRRLSAKWLPTFADRGCHVVSVTDPYGRILDFLSSSSSVVLTRLSGPRSRPTTFFL